MNGYEGQVTNLIHFIGTTYNRSSNEVLKLFTTCYEKLKINYLKAINLEIVNVNRPEPKFSFHKLPYEKG